MWLIGLDQRLYADCEPDSTKSSLLISQVNVNFHVTVLCGVKIERIKPQCVKKPKASILIKKNKIPLYIKRSKVSFFCE